MSLRQLNAELAALARVRWGRPRADWRCAACRRGGADGGFGPFRAAAAGADLCYECSPPSDEKARVAADMTRLRRQIQALKGRRPGRDAAELCARAVQN